MDLNPRNYLSTRGSRSRLEDFSRSRVTFDPYQHASLLRGGDPEHCVTVATLSHEGAYTAPKGLRLCPLNGDRIGLTRVGLITDYDAEKFAATSQR